MRRTLFVIACALSVVACGSEKSLIGPSATLTAVAPAQAGTASVTDGRRRARPVATVPGSAIPNSDASIPVPLPTDGYEFHPMPELDRRMFRK